ncbi:uncharacterized protein LOC129575597 [Sitodiplosis mosellana]|uniref:uncharacterized protein LOC129575597 n=1 Tax=Sitodiplosis mosellana TaxID=263140 RepID=UPI002443DCA5|nr:uncharacterized protein LOC129575597 [Sitodiplosis mosellana]
MAKSFSDGRRSNVVNILSSLKVYSLQYFPHNLHPNNTLFLNGKDEHAADETINPSLGVQATYPLKLDLATDINLTVENNIVLKLVYQKNDYINDVAKLTGNYKRSKGGATKRNKGNIYSMHLNNLMEITAKDPDPYFFGSYNWYYTGGTLETASIFDIDFLFYVSGEKLNIFNSAKLVPTKDQLQLEHLDSTNNKICDTIFEITKSNDSCYVAARQKKRFTLFYLQDELTQQEFQCERNIPFMSGTFTDKYFFTINANRIIQQHDLGERRECGRMHLKLPKNNSFWCQLKSYDNQLLFADENKVKIYDSRLFAKKASKCMEISVDSITEKCEEITCIETDASEHNVYVSTTHHLFVFDVRYGMESGNQLTRYTHQMKTPPMMIECAGGGATGTAPNERLIALSGTFTDDIAIAQHIKSQNDKLRNNNIPQKIVSLSDALYKKLRENGLRSEAENLFNVNRSINIGTRFIRINSNLFLLSEKSSGEIFYQQITPDEGDETQEIDDKLFCNLDLDTRNENHSTVTSVTNFDSIKRILNFNLPDETEVPDMENPKVKRWQLSMEQLASYKDMLSADLLNVWNEQQLSTGVRKTDKTEFVNCWIDRTSTVTQCEDDVDAPKNSFSMF